MASQYGKQVAAEAEYHSPVRWRGTHYRKAELDMVAAVIGGLMNKEIVATIILNGGKAVGISCVDGRLNRG